MKMMKKQQLLQPQEIQIDQVMTIDSISYAEIDPSKFALPPAIATMVKAKEAEATKPTEEASKE